ncbi:MAG: hypothetical protein Q4G69_02070 [Planctomycetia bacterium]|nr:hypothetical protein [Planctomycetia bacterium]
MRTDIPRSCEKKKKRFDTGSRGKFFVLKTKILLLFLFLGAVLFIHLFNTVLSNEKSEPTVRGADRAPTYFTGSIFNRLRKSEKKPPAEESLESEVNGTVPVAVERRSAFPKRRRRDPLLGTSPDNATAFPTITENRGVCLDLTEFQSPWARFLPGSWCRTQTAGTTFQNGKALKSITETKLTLKSVEDDGYTLSREVIIKMGGMDHVNLPEEIKYDFWGTPIESNRIVQELSPCNVVVNRKIIPCQLRRISRTTPQWKEETTLYYSPVIAPYIIQKEVKRTSLLSDLDPNKTEQIISQSTMNVQKTSAHLFLGKDLSTYRSKTTTHKGDCTAVANTLHSEGVPGNIVRENTIEKNNEGAIVYQSTTILLDYSVVK